MRSSPLLSIIIPTYNRCDLLPKAIESALAQSIEDREVLVCDNASTDQTDDLRESYEARGVRWVRNGENLGLCGNLHTAVFHHCKGKYFVVLSDDDYLTDTAYLEDACTFLETNPDIGFVHANIVMEDVRSGTIRELDRKIPERMQGKDFFLSLGKSSFDFAYLMTVVARTEKAKTAGFFSESEIPHGDSLAWLTMSLTSNVGFLSRNVASYVLHDANAIFNPKINAWVKDIRFFEIAYARALSSQIFSEAELKEWRHRMRHSYCGKVIDMLTFAPSMREAIATLGILQREHQIAEDPRLWLRAAKAFTKRIFRR